MLSWRPVGGGKHETKAHCAVVSIPLSPAGATCSFQVSLTEQRLATLYEYVDDTEDYIAIDQDSHRNQLIQLDVLATAGMISLTFITVRRLPLPNLAPSCCRRIMPPSV